MDKSLSLRDQQCLWHPFTQAKIAPKPIAIARAEGCYLYTDANKKLFDGISSWWTNAHGHCHTYISEAITRQLSKLEHVMFANFTHEPAVRLAERLLDIAPSGLSRVFYSDNGSTAVEVAIKMAFQYWQHRKEDRPLFVALEHGYHGDTFGAMSVSERSVYTKPFWPLLFNVRKTVSPCVSEISFGRSEDDLTKQGLQALESLLEAHRNQVAGIILEPMLQIAGGMRIFTRGFLRGIKQLCQKHDLLLIADEAATGFFRTGTCFASNHETVTPDIMCLAKGLTGGYLPLAATLATEKIYQAFLSDNKADALLHGHTFTANPLGCAAALASVDLFAMPETQDQIKAIVHTIELGMKSFHNLSSVKNARNIGTVAIIELNTENAGYLSHAADQISEHCFEKGLFIRPLGHLIYFMPPFAATSQEVTWALNLIHEAINASYSAYHKDPNH